MNTYGKENSVCGKHTLQATIQYGSAKGFITRKIGGNCFGLAILENHFDFEDMYVGSILKLETSENLNIKYDEDNDVFHVVLKDEDGKVVSDEDFRGRELNDMIVALEIIDYVAD